MLDSNQRPPACEAGALPTELIDRDVGFYGVTPTASTERDCDVHENVPASFWATPSEIAGFTMSQRTKTARVVCRVVRAA